MTRATVPTADPIGVYAVPAPRRTDAMGQALGQAYACRSDDAPAVFASILARLR